MNNSKHGEHFDETIYEEYENEKMETISPTDPGTTYRDTTKLENKTNYFDPLSLAKSPSSKKASTSNRFQIMPKRTETTTEPITSLNSKTKLKPVSSPNSKITKSMKNSTDDMIAPKLNIRPKNVRVPVRSFEPSEKDKKLLAFDLEEKNVDDIMIVDSVKSQETL